MLPVTSAPKGDRGEGRRGRARVREVRTSFCLPSWPWTPESERPPRVELGSSPRQGDALPLSYDRVCACRERDSNPQPRRFELRASAGWATSAKLRGQESNPRVPRPKRGHGRQRRTPERGAVAGPRTPCLLVGSQPLYRMSYYRAASRGVEPLFPDRGTGGLPLAELAMSALPLSRTETPRASTACATGYAKRAACHPLWTFQGAKPRGTWRTTPRGKSVAVQGKAARSRRVGGVSAMCMR